VFSIASYTEYKQNKVITVCVCVCNCIQVIRVCGLTWKHFVMKKMSYIVFCSFLHFGYMMNLIFSGERGVDGFKVTNRYTR
jgi:hypothetical protein